MMPKQVAGLYESCVFNQLLGETLRPGGLELTARLAKVGGIVRSNTVLDIACGKGTSALFIANKYGCQCVGVDMSDKMISSCRNKANKEKLNDRVSFLLGDVERLPFRDSSFDTVMSECSLSLIPDKEAAAQDILRILKPKGTFLVTDIILRREISDELRNQIPSVCCLAGAWQLDEYVSLFERIGFKSHYIEDHSHELRKVAYRLGIMFGSIDRFIDSMSTGPCRIKKAGDSEFSSVESYRKFIKVGKPGYALMVMTKV
jgi:ubiquinone/menaquinone biosynthesis C-methylase UbiE